MAVLLKKAEFNEFLRNYYLEHYGEEESDIWYEQPAVNVWVFGRGDKIISLKSHVLTCEVEEYIETKQI